MNINEGNSKQCWIKVFKNACSECDLKETCSQCETAETAEEKKEKEYIDSDGCL